MLLIYSDKFTQRLQYILQELLQRRLGLIFSLTQDWDFFLASQEVKINYSNQTDERALNILPHGLLDETTIVKQNISVKKHPDWRFIFFEQNTNIPFDIFSAAFYLLSRYEEYNLTQTDKHGRFLHEQSLAFQNGFEHIPLVDIWAQQLGFELKKMFPAIEIKQKHFQFLSTVDIDFAFRYTGIGLTRQIGKLFKSFLQRRFSDVSSQLFTFFGGTKDPYDTYDYIHKITQSSNQQLQYFVLMCSGTDYDKTINPHSPEMNRLLKRLSAKANIGAHPSYNSTEEISLMKEEKTLLENHIGKEISNSRQHFLRVKFPTTFRNLIEAKIENDFSLGYTNHCGFRASTTNSFLFFDLERNEQTRLLLHPVAAMDTALRYGMKLNVKEAKQKAEQLMNEVEKTGGTFISIWHNSNLGKEEGWQEWREVFEKIHTLASIKTESI